MTDATGLDREVRAHIYESFVSTGTAPSVDALTTALALPREDVSASLDRLAEAHDIALAPGTKNIWMAHPFSATPTPYPVRAGERSYWAACAWDALAIPALLGADGETATKCADCGEELVIRVVNGRVTPEDLVVHFLIPPKRFWDNVGFT